MMYTITCRSFKNSAHKLAALAIVHSRNGQMQWVVSVLPNATWPVMPHM